MQRRAAEESLTDHGKGDSNGRAHVGDAIRHKPEMLGFLRQIGFMGATPKADRSRSFWHLLSHGTPGRTPSSIGRTTGIRFSLALVPISKRARGNFVSAATTINPGYKTADRATSFVCGTYLSRHSPDDIQIRGNCTTVPPPRELHPFRSHPMA